MTTNNINKLEEWKGTVLPPIVTTHFHSKTEHNSLDCGQQSSKCSKQWLWRFFLAHTFAYQDIRAPWMIRRPFIRCTQHAEGRTMNNNTVTNQWSKTCYITHLPPLLQEQYFLFKLWSATSLGHHSVHPHDDNNYTTDWFWSLEQKS